MIVTNLIGCFATDTARRYEVEIVGLYVADLFNCRTVCRSLATGALYTTEVSDLVVHETQDKVGDPK